ncbi:LOW QUALITY PROTEIN: hypothetical protein Cgig2_011633 [Carnegiea gigantea]|uniref:Uncharacterized protein n=1 Tax=Carnegiea gigantea TaxID=171969 RepID=A0A9Q1GMW8_9CARY|nr:LOW QUALITY PROTEIN: hypothetical protein Cgig2_011633 [Carnegiea gigantea]
MNTSHTSKDEVSFSIFDIHSSRGLPLLGRVYDEVIPTQWKLINKLPLSYTYLFAACYKLRQGHKGKLTIEQWIAFWFPGRNKYHISKKDAGCIRPGTFRVTSFMASGVGYCLHTTIHISACRGLNEISRSSHPGRSGGYFPIIFFMFAKNFDAYELVSEASSSLSIVKFSVLVKPSCFSSKKPENSLVLGGAFAGIHPSPTNLKRLSWMTTSYQELTSLILSAFVRVLSLTVVRTTLSWSATSPTDSVDDLVSIRMFPLIWISIIFLIQK